MPDKPILFSAPMVRALLDGRKTQTRRVLKPQPDSDVISYGEHDNLGRATWTDQSFISHRLRYAIRDRLWVREAWYAAHSADDVAPRDMGPDWKICTVVDWNYADWGIHGRFRQGMHMPRWASRLTLTVTDVRVQRVQEISEDDAKAEGAPFEPGGPEELGVGYRIGFINLWDSINGNRPGCSWADNPWVAAYSFSVQRGNIDELANG